MLNRYNCLSHSANYLIVEGNHDVAIQSLIQTRAKSKISVAYVQYHK